MTMSIETGTHETIGDKAKRLARAMREAGSGPLTVAVEVVDLAARWDSFAKEETGGLDASAWLRKFLGQPIAYFERRADAVERIGKREAAGWDHDAAVWALRFEDAAQFRLLCDRVIFERKRKNGKLLGVDEVYRIALKAKLIRQTRRGAGACARCARMAEALRAAGVEVPE